MTLAAAGVLLAASASEALGEPVQLVDTGGRPLLERMVDKLSGLLEPLIVVLGWRAEEILAAADLDAVTVIIDYDWEADPGSAMRAGLDHLARERVHRPAFVVLGDQPGVRVELLEDLHSAHAGEVTLPVYRYEWGYPLLIDRSQWDRFMSRGLDPLDIARAHPEWVTEVRMDQIVPRRVVVPSDIPELVHRFGTG